VSITDPQLVDEANGNSRIKLHLSFFELLGNEATDLLAAFKKTHKGNESSNDKAIKQSTVKYVKPSGRWNPPSKPADKAKEERPGKVDIMEDKFGRINMVGATEVPIEKPEDFVTMVNTALAHRRTQTTFKNDTSSRSHAICTIRVENVHLKEAEDGKIFIIGDTAHVLGHS
jgi:hypothetical protein